MKKYFLLLVFVSCSFLCSSQQAIVMKIDSFCEQIDKKIADEFLLPHTLMGIVNRPGTGIQNNTIDFFYNALNSEISDPEEDTFGNFENRILSKVVCKYNFAMSQFITETYYIYENNLVCFNLAYKTVFDESVADSVIVYFENLMPVEIRGYRDGEKTLLNDEYMPYIDKAVNRKREFLEFFTQINLLIH